jgi:predicted DNA-binding transcriptional regulator YafY
MPIEKCVGRIVDIIYQDRKGNITKRQISVYHVHDGKVRAFDTSKQAFRSLSITGILAVQLLGKRPA